MMTGLELLDRVKENLIIQHREDDTLIENYITAAISYAEQYQHKKIGYYCEADSKNTATTEQAVIMLASYFYESRDGSTGGYFASSATASNQTITTVNMLLRLDRDWQV